MAAGTASMMAVEGSGAEPAGTYSPTARIGTLKRSQSTPGAVSTRSGAGTLRRVKRAHVGDRALEGRVLLRRSARARRRRIPARDTASASSRTAIEALGQRQQRRIAVAAHRLDDVARRGRDAPRPRAAPGAASAARRCAGGQRFPVEDAHGIVRPQASIFSTGRTSTERRARALQVSRASPRTRFRGTPRAPRPDRRGLRAE